MSIPAITAETNPPMTEIRISMIANPKYLTHQLAYLFTSVESSSFFLWYYNIFYDEGALIILAHLKSNSISKCKNPDHKLHVANFIKKYPMAKGRVPPKTIILVDPEDWAVAVENPKLNTTECCQVCSIAEGIARARKGIGTTDLGQACSCEWKHRV